MKKSAWLLALLLTACNPDPTATNGYIEGEYLYLAPTTSGLLQKLAVHRGDYVEKNAPLFSIDRTHLQATLASAQAEKASAEASHQAAAHERQRYAALVPTGAASPSDYDTKKAEEAASAAAVRQAQQKIVQIEKQLSEASPRAPEAGHIEDTYYKEGEYIAAGTPVLSFLPPGNVKIRFFVPQAELSLYTPGTKISIHADGLKEPQKGTVTYVASQSEYTPPVIYSAGSRDKLVFLVEAKPDIYTEELRPGLPVDIERTTP